MRYLGILSCLFYAMCRRSSKEPMGTKQYFSDVGTKLRGLGQSKAVSLCIHVNIEYNVMYHFPSTNRTMSEQRIAM
jgi:hypothetical protein